MAMSPAVYVQSMLKRCFFWKQHRRKWRFHRGLVQCLHQGCQLHGVCGRTGARTRAWSLYMVLPLRCSKHYIYILQKSFACLWILSRSETLHLFAMPVTWSGQPPCIEVDVCFLHWCGLPAIGR